MRWPAIKTAAVMQAVGMDGAGWLLRDDPEERLVLVAVAEEALKVQRQFREELATLIINKLARALKG